MKIKDLKKRGDKYFDTKGNMIYRIIDDKVYEYKNDNYILLKENKDFSKEKKKNLFVDYNRTPKEIYSKFQWDHVETLSEFKKFVNSNLDNLPDIISLDYDLEKRREGLSAVRFLVNKCIRFGIKLPKIFVHCDDRTKIIEYENELDIYTKKTSKSYLLEYLKRF